MTKQRIFLTGASGCIGHYISDALIHDTDHELFLMVRSPDKLKVDVDARPGVTVIKSDMREIERLEALLKTIDTVILTAAAWGGAQDTYDINVSKTLTLLGMLDPDACKQVIYFSTESILDRNNQPLKQAKELGTDYIRTKALCHQQMARLAIAPKVTTLFPTLVFGGDEQKPKSHLSAGIRDVVKWIGWIRFLKADGSFHIVHARDIAFVVKHLVDHPPAADAPRELVLGSPPITVNQAIEEACAYFHKRIYLRLPLSMWLADVLIKVFKIEMASWDRFCLEYRHFTHRDPVSPATFGGVPYCANISDLFKLSGIPPA